MVHMMQGQIQDIYEGGASTRGKGKHPWALGALDSSGKVFQ